MSSFTNRFKPLFLSHGQPTLIIDDQDPARKFLIELGKKFKGDNKPKSIVIVSAHWESSPIEVTSSTELIYDFYGFPKKMYEFKYSAPTNEKLALKVVDLLKNASIESKYNPKRGIDHGTWVPLALMYPDADIPIVQVSLNANLNMDDHINVGKALRPLIEEGIQIIASGGSTHSFDAIRNSGGKTDGWIHAFEEWVQDVLIKDESQRNDALTKWEETKYGRKAHPREEHFIPLGVASGASNGKGKRLYTNIQIPNFSLSFYEFETHE